MAQTQNSGLLKVSKIMMEKLAALPPMFKAHMTVDRTVQNVASDVALVVGATVTPSSISIGQIIQTVRGERERTLETVTLDPGPFLGQEYEDRLPDKQVGDSVSYELVVDGTDLITGNAAAIAAEGFIYGSVTPLGNGLSVREIHYVSPTRPIFTDFELDPQTNILVKVTRQAVPASPVPTDAGLTSGTYIEYKQWDEYWTIRMTSTIYTSGAGALSGLTQGPYITTEPYNFPDVLDSIERFRESGERTQDAEGNFHSVTIGAEFSFSGEAAIGIKRGAIGDVKQSVTVTYSVGPPDLSAETIQNFRLSSGTVIVQGGRTSNFVTYSVNEDTSGISTDEGFSINYRGIVIPPVITASIGSGADDAASHTQAGIFVRIPASNPTTVPSTFTARIKVEVARLNLYRATKYVIVATPT